jgi:16S rRNA (uracil1498-N3)-methyltransferase
MTHVLYDPTLTQTSGRFVVGGEEAHHALRVKRLTAGDVVRVQDGAGGVVECRIVRAHKGRDGWGLELEAMGPSRRVERVRPIVHVRSAAPKGDRLEAMIDALSQCGAASWSVLGCAHSVVEPRAGKMSRLRRTTEESLKQCGRAWLMEIGEPIDFDRALCASRGTIVLADATGETCNGAIGDEVTLLVGPEGGFSERELGMAQDAGACVCSFGPHAMRIETAAAAACAIIMRGARV